MKRHVMMIDVNIFVQNVHYIDPRIYIDKI